jgi:hypothetical protein
MSTTTKNTQPTTTISQAESRYGNAEPQIALRYPKGTHHRVVKAALLKLAADLELATPANESWLVNIEEYCDASGRVDLELVNATPAEATRGMALLKTLMG